MKEGPEPGSTRRHSNRSRTDRRRRLGGSARVYNRRVVVRSNGSAAGWRRELYVSLPWTVASRSGSRVVIRHPAPPACGSTQGSPFESDIESDAGRTNATFRVHADVAAVRPPCHSPDHDTVVENAPPNATLLHVKTGVSVGYDTSGTSLTYYDGTTHTI